MNQDQTGAPSPRTEWRDPLLWFALAAKVVVLVLCVVTLLNPDLPQFRGKVMTARAIAFPVGIAVVPAVWWWRTRRGQGTGRYPAAADLLLTLPFIVDLGGNALDLYDPIPWYDDITHFSDHVLIAAAMSLLLPRAGLGRLMTAGLIVGINAVSIILWEEFEFLAFIRHTPEYFTAYRDTLGDEVLGVFGAAIVAGLAIRFARWPLPDPAVSLAAAPLARLSDDPPRQRDRPQSPGSIGGIFDSLLPRLHLAVKVSLVVIALVVMQQRAALGITDDPNEIRPLLYALGAGIVPLIWWLVARGRQPRPPYPYLADILLTLPLILEVLSYGFIFVETNSWLANVLYVVNWSLLTMGVGLLLAPARLGRLVTACFALGAGALFAIFWEAAEFLALRGRLPTYEVAYAGIIRDHTLALGGSALATLVLVAMIRRAAPSAGRREARSERLLTGDADVGR